MQTTLTGDCLHIPVYVLVCIYGLLRYTWVCAYIYIYIYIHTHIHNANRLLPRYTCMFVYTFTYIYTHIMLTDCGLLVCVLMCLCVCVCV